MSADERIRWSDDPNTPNDRIRVERDAGIACGGTAYSGLVYIADETTPFRGTERADPVCADVITLTPAKARWALDQLVSMDLDDGMAVKA
jgi:hypothetical protein